MKNILKLIFVAAALLLVFVSCNSDVKEADINKITDALNKLEATQNTIVYTRDGENTLDADYMEYYFGDPSFVDGIEDYVYYTSATTNVNEIGVFKLSDNGIKEKLLEAFATRAETLASTFALYSEEDEKIALGYKAGALGDALYFVATSDNDAVLDAINQ